jgi:polyhydroxybutyrate depolymerase
MKKITASAVVMLSLIFFLLAADDCQPPDTEPVDHLPTMTCEPGYPAESGIFHHTIESGGLAREYRLYIPSSYDPKQGSALVVVLHGIWCDMDKMAEKTRYEDKAEAQGFIVLFPQGIGDSWNAGDCCGEAQQQGVDDVAFLVDLIHFLVNNYCIDSRYIFFAGLSNGGFMSYRMACEQAGMIAAIGPVAGDITVDDCAPSRPVPLLHSHGTMDPVVRYKRGLESVQFWAQYNSCEAKTTSQEFNDAYSDTYSFCQQDATVKMYTFTGGHEWPLADSAESFDATDATWEFFKNHRL